MSIFFEKLTGSHPKTSGSARVPAAPELQRDVQDAVTADLRAPKPVASPPKPTAQNRTRPEQTETPEHADSHEAPVSEKDIPDIEEEGELTVDIYEKDDTIVIQSTVAGVKPEDLEVSITSDTVSIKGTRQPVDRVSEEHYYYKELFWGTFARTVLLPEEIDENNTEASLKHGMLIISLPKKKKGIPQKVKIKTI